MDELLALCRRVLGDGERAEAVAHAAMLEASVCYWAWS